MFKRIISIGLPAVLFLASLGWYYGNLLTGARRLVHDTSIFFHPGLAYLSDSLAQGVFPFWDPFSTPGASTAVLQIYSPLYIAFEWLLYHSQEVVVLYFICFGLIGMVGTYQWLRHQSLPKPLALVGAIAYVGSAPYLDAQSQFTIQLTMAFIPWVFLSVDLLMSKVDRRDAMKGTFLLVFSVWMMVSGGYHGLNYMTFLFVGIYVLARFFMNRAIIIQTLQFGALAILLSLGLVFLQLSEMLMTVDQLTAVRQTSTFDPYLGSLLLDSPLRLFLPNGVYAPGMFGNDLMYMSIILTLGIPAGLITVGLKKVEALFLGLASLIILASMGAFSPVAVFFVEYVPGFSLFRWHYYNSILVILLLIALSLRLFAQFQIQAFEQPELRRRYAMAVIASTVLVCLTVAVLMIVKSSVSLMVQPTWYDLITTAFAFLLSISLACWFFFYQRHAFHAQNIRNRIFLMSTFLLILIFVAVMFFRFFPPQIVSYFVQLLGGSSRLVESTLEFGFSALVGPLDAKVLAISAWKMFSIDIFILGVSVGIFALWILFDRKPPRQAYWAIVVFILADMLLAVPRYQQGVPYFIAGQIAPKPVERSASISYTENVRDPGLSYVSLTSWKPDKGYENFAIQLRRPTLMSYYGPFINPDILALMKQPGGVAAFSKLVWLLPKNKVASMETWGKEAIEPDIQALSLQPNQLEIVLKTSSPARLVWTDAWNAGWTVSVNGVTTDLHRVLGVLKGVDVPLGISRVIFSYQPTFYGIGIVLFLGALFGLICVGFLSLKGKVWYLFAKK